jgi:hypothetical protein
MPDLEADLEQLVDVAALLVSEHKRLTGTNSATVFADNGPEQVSSCWTACNACPGSQPRLDCASVAHGSTHPSWCVCLFDPVQDVSATENPLYQPHPKADPELVPEESKKDAAGKAKPDEVEERYDDDFAADE